MKNQTYKIGQKFEVKRVGFGTMRLTAGEGKWGMPKDKQNAITVLKKAVEIGVDFFDTADMYGPGYSEEIIAEALHPYSTKIVIATKGGNLIFGENKVKADCSPAALNLAVTSSLKRLKLDCIDLYQLHTVDPNVEIEFSIEVLAHLREKGKIKCIGLSNINANDLSRAMKVTKIDCVQNRFNLIDKTSLELIQMAAKSDIAFLSYYPLAKGQLAKDDFADEIVPKNSEISVPQKALLWQLQQFGNVIVIPGTTRLDHMVENFSTLKYL